MDGHFWVVRDGKIIDPYFKSYDYVIKVNNLEGDRVYLPASPLIQAVMKKRFIDGSMQTAAMLLRQHIIQPHTRRDNCCNINAILETYNGGEIIFGSMGWKQKDSDEIWWEFGGDDYTVKDFLGLN